MRLSTLDSETSVLLYVKALLVICGVSLLLIESVSVYLVKHYSATFARVSQQYMQAITVRLPKDDERPTVVMVGNSLLMDGIELDRLRELTSSSMRIYPIFLEGTTYYDWLYGLKRLFSRGAKPKVVILGLGVDNLLETGIRQDYSPMMLFDAKDILVLASDLSLDRTATTNLLLAHWSVFWDIRGVVRIQVLRHVIPRFEDLISIITRKDHIQQDPKVEARAISRLRALRKLCESHGSKLIFLVPPTPDSGSALPYIVSASRKASVDTLVPINPTWLSTKFYQPDAIHLNAEGAALFTAALVADLPKTIGNRETLSSSD